MSHPCSTYVLPQIPHLQSLSTSQTLTTCTSISSVCGCLQAEERAEKEAQRQMEKDAKNREREEAKKMARYPIEDAEACCSALPSPLSPPLRPCSGPPVQALHFQPHWFEHNMVVLTCRVPTQPACDVQPARHYPLPIAHNPCRPMTHVF